MNNLIDWIDQQRDHTKGMISCPKCGSLAFRGSKPGWAYGAAILLTLFVFPLGLLGWLAPLLVPRTPTRCPRCQFRWVA